MPANLLLREALEANEFNVDKVAADIKKQLNVCKLTKYNNDQCAKFYSSFFLQALEDVSPDVSQWGSIYTKLLSEDKFCEDLATFMIMFKPSIYEGLFVPLWAAIQSEAARKTKDRIRFLQLTKAMLVMIQTRMAAVTNMIKSQIQDINTLKFATTSDQVLGKLVFDIQALINMEIAKSVSPDDVTYTRNVGTVPLTEGMQELIALFESASAKLATYDIAINEAIAEDVSMKIKEAKLNQKKAERQFDELVMNKIRNIREERRNQKHAEMVGESIRAMREIKRILRTAPIALLSPAAAAVVFLMSIAYDRATDKQDRKVLVDQLRDELEITNEKIQMAERNGDDKARIELIRFRQKLEREYERIMKVRFDGAARARNL